MKIPIGKEPKEYSKAFKTHACWDTSSLTRKKAMMMYKPTHHLENLHDRKSSHLMLLYQDRSQVSPLPAKLLHWSQTGLETRYNITVLRAGWALWKTSSLLIFVLQWNSWWETNPLSIPFFFPFFLTVPLYFHVNEPLTKCQPSYETVFV